MERHVSRSVANFGAKLFKEADSRQSTVCSPLSAEMVMAMLALGCKDKSNTELLTALDIPDDDALLPLFAFLKSTLKSVRGVTLNVANKMYVKTGAELKPGIKKNAKDVFESSLEQIDFNRQGAAANAINNWLAEQTNGTISLGAALDVSTRLVLVNAIYFQGVWEKPFDTRLNTYCLFHMPYYYHTTAPVTFMRIPKTWFNYGISQELKARLKFEGGEASMVVVLPDETDGLRSILQKLDSGHNIMADIETLKNTELDVMMPIFEGRITSQVNFVSHLVKLGIRSIFDERKSEVDMFTESDELLGSNAGQNTLIKVDDRESTRNADCSMSTVEEVSTDPCVEHFVANRPFLYMIIVRGLPIFMGSYKGSQQTILNYSCNTLTHSFSLSVCTFYSRYDNTREQERLKQSLENNSRRVVWDAQADNRRNTLIERRQRNLRNPIDHFDVDELGGQRDLINPNYFLDIVDENMYVI